MNRNIFIASFLAGIIISGAYAFSPSSASALSVNEIQAQINTLLAKIAEVTANANASQGQTNASVSSATGASSASPAYSYRICSLLGRNLARGASGDDVSGLQEFLSSTGYFSAQATGYFGPLTAQALAQWQISQGISGVGAMGPVTRARIGGLCGTPAPSACKPLTYMPVLCSDGTAPQGVHDANGCLTGYTCPIANFTPPANCSAWNDGCNVCSRTSPDAAPTCTERACFAAGKGYCSAYFTTTNRAPVISGFSGPTTLTVNEAGTWNILASDPDNGTLSYSVSWGDENAAPASNASAAANAFVQTTTFTHTYATAGTYTMRIVVTDNAGMQSTTSTTVSVSGGATVCNMLYQPVCGQPPEPACVHATPACMIAIQGPQTYPNRCQLDAAGATFLYESSCTTQPIACTADAMQCPNGSYVGRTGPNCQFVCPTQ